MKNKYIYIEKIGYSDDVLSVTLRRYYGENKYTVKHLKFMNVKSFSHHFSHDFLNLYNEFHYFTEELGINFFLEVFYRNPKEKKIYIFDGIESFMIIEFHENKIWKYRKQKK